MNKCWMFKTRTLLTSLNGSPTILSHPFVISLPRAWRWQSPSLETQLLSRKCSRELLSNSLPCSEEKLSCIGTPVKEWTRWNSLRLNPTWTILSLSINSIKMPLLKKKVNSMKKKPDFLCLFTLITSKYYFNLYIVIINLCPISLE